MDSDRVIRTIDHAVEAIEKHLAGDREIKLSKQHDMQITNFKESLLKYKNEISQGKKPTADGSMGRIIADFWPYSSLIGELVIKAEKECMR